MVGGVPGSPWPSHDLGAVQPPPGGHHHLLGPLQPRAVPHTQVCGHSVSLCVIGSHLVVLGGSGCPWTLLGATGCVSVGANVCHWVMQCKPGCNSETGCIANKTGCNAIRMHCNQDALQDAMQDRLWFCIACCFALHLVCNASVLFAMHLVPEMQSGFALSP